MASQRTPGRWTIATPRLLGIVLSLVIMLAIFAVVAALLLDDDEEQPSAVAEELVASGAWVRVVPGAMAEGGAGDAAAMTPAATEMAGEGGGMASSGMNAGAFLTLRNGTEEDARLVGVSVAPEVARVAELHETTVDENDVMRMRPVEWIEIPAGGEVELAPGGLHIMLIDVHPGLKVGDTVELTLRFEGDEVLLVTADVREAS